MKEDIIAGIHGHVSYRELVIYLKSLRPVIPTYNYQSNNTEEWKANSLRQEGFDLCLNALKINLE